MSFTRVSSPPSSVPTRFGSSIRRTACWAAGVGALLVSFGCATPAPSARAPELAAPSDSSTRYQGLKQVYDVAIMTGEADTKRARMTHVMNVAAYHLGLTPLADLHLTAKDRGSVPPQIVIVLHGNELDLFARKNASEHGELLQTARNLFDAGVRFRACRGASWLLYNLKAEDMVDFVEMVPGGEAEVAWLQQTGFGYNFFQYTGP